MVLFYSLLLIPGGGAADMNYSGGYTHIDKGTGSKIYPPAAFFQIAEYLSERGFAVLRYDKRGIGTNHTLLDSNVWGNATFNDLKQDAEKALSVVLQQPEDMTTIFNLMVHKAERRFCAFLVIIIILFISIKYSILYLYIDSKLSEVDREDFHLIKNILNRYGYLSNKVSEELADMNFTPDYQSILLSYQ